MRKEILKEETVIDAAGTESRYEYDSMNRLTKVSMHRVDDIHGVDEWQDTLYTYDHRGLVKTEVNAKGDGKVFVYDENGNLIFRTDEDGYVTEYSYSPVNLVSAVDYNGAKQAAYLYNGTGEVPPGQNVDEDGNIVNNGGNTPPGLNRREKPDKGENPNPLIRVQKTNRTGMWTKLSRARISTPTTN